MTTDPKISIIIPSFNQGEYPEQTITSILDQRYPNTGLIIIDGGSTDTSVEVIKKYESGIKYWISEKDRGQSHAINKGLSHVTGDIVAWLNSDDWYEPDTLFKVAAHWKNGPGFDVLHGNAIMYFENAPEKNFVSNYGGNSSLYRLLKYWSNDRDCNFPQPSALIRKTIFDDLGPVNETLHYAMDYDLWMRIAQAGYQFQYTPEVFSNYRFHGKSKSGTVIDLKHFHKEWHQVYEQNIVRVPLRDRISFYWDYTGFYYGYSKKKWPERFARLLLQGPVRKSKY